LEQVLHALVRLVIGRLTLAKLQELVQKVYVQEAERRLKEDFPDGRVSLSQLALLTGIDTRTLKKQTNSPSHDLPASEDDEFLTKMTPETRVISTWLSDSVFSNKVSGKPRTLPIGAGQGSFADLVKTALSGRGYTYQSVLARLEKAGSISVDRKRQRVTLINNNFYPFLSDDETAMLDVGFSTVIALLKTIANNIENALSDENRFFQRLAFTYQLSPRRKAEFRRKVRAFLTKADTECRALMAPMEDSSPHPGQLTAGVSLFYFETSSGF
jgi:hypothetical protein